MSDLTGAMPGGLLCCKGHACICRPVCVGASPQCCISYRIDEWRKQQTRTVGTDPVSCCCCVTRVGQRTCAWHFTACRLFSCCPFLFRHDLHVEAPAQQLQNLGLPDASGQQHCQLAAQLDELGSASKQAFAITAYRPLRATAFNSQVKTKHGV